MSFLRRFSPQRFREDRGAVAVMASIMMVPIIIASAAIGIDTSNWYYTGHRLQTAADAAALAGAVYMPGDPDAALAAARDVASRNGFGHNPSDPDVGKRTWVTTEQGHKSSQLRVTITATRSNFFGWSMDQNEQTISRTAVGEYRGPVAMGSPCAVYGNEPSGGSSSWSTAAPSEECSSNPEFWAEIDGPGNYKVNGDRWSPRICRSSGSSQSVSGCTGGGSMTNQEYAPTGHFFKMSVTEPVTSVSVEVFDPILTHMGISCTRPSSSYFPSSWSYYQNPYSSNGPNQYTNDAHTTSSPNGSSSTGRYERGESQFCTGDEMGSGQATTSVTTFAVRDPIASTNPLQAPVRSECTRQFRGVSNSTNYTTALRQGHSSYNSLLAQTFRQWYSLCTINNPEVGDYYIQARTNLPATCSQLVCSGAPTASVLTSTTEYPTVSWYGFNGYALRAKVTGNQAAVDVSGYGSMTLFSNSDQADINFHLARVNAATAGMSMDINLFDTGDANQAGTITIIPPPDATSGGQPLTNLQCEGMGEVVGEATNGTSLSQCQLTNVSSSAGYQGSSQVVRVAIPVDYQCDEEDPYGCWFRIRFQYPGGVHDTSTWATDLVGQPVRLVE